MDAQGDGLAGAAAQVVQSVKGAAAAGVEKAKEAADVAKAHLLPLPAEEEATPAPVRTGCVSVIGRGTRYGIQVFCIVSEEHRKAV